MKKIMTILILAFFPMVASANDRNILEGGTVDEIMQVCFAHSSRSELADTICSIYAVAATRAIIGAEAQLRLSTSQSCIMADFSRTQDTPLVMFERVLKHIARSPTHQAYLQQPAAAAFGMFVGEVYPCR